MLIIRCIVIAELEQKGVQVMNLTKFTQKSMQAVEGCEKLAYEYGNQEIEQEHLLYSLLKIEESLILKLIEKMEIQKEHFVDRVERQWPNVPRSRGARCMLGLT